VDARMWGFLTGIFLTAVVVAVSSYVRRRKRAKSGEIWDDSFDERQQAARGKAFEAAFFTLLFYLLVNAAVIKIAGIWAQPGVDGVMGIFISIGVFGIICIRSDAFMTLREKPKTYLLLFGLVVLIQTMASVDSLHTFTTDGLLNWNLLSPVCGVLFLILMASLLLKMRRDRLTDGDDI